MKRKRFPAAFSCPRCRQIATRVFNAFLEKQISNGKQISERCMVPAYVELDWLGCAKENCRNYFEKRKSISRCPICKLWSLKFSLIAGVKRWGCKNRDCEWSFRY